VLVAAGCGRSGFDETKHTTDAAIFDAEGSGVPPMFVPPWHSGPRLRARLLVGGGDPIFNGWHDSLLDTDCQPAIATDGQERCMPFGARIDLYYSDASCTQPLGAVYRGTCGSTSYAFADTGVRHAYPLGAVFSGTVYENAGGCGKATVPARFEVRALGAEAPPETFVLSTYHHQVVGAFEHSFNDFSDGTTIDTGALVFANASCNPNASELGPVRCRVTAPAAAPAYTDPACTQKILAWNRQPYDPPSVDALVVFGPQACDATYTYYRVTADVTAPQYYEYVGGMCTMLATAPNTVLYTVQQTTDPSPVGTVVRGPNRGRIGTLYWVGPDNIAIPTGNFDQQTGLPCTPFNAADANLRCLPAAGASTLATEDATCSGMQQLIVSECYGAPPVDGPTYRSCIDAPWPVRVLTTTFTAASESFDGTCVPIDLPGGTGHQVGVTGAEIDATSFPPLIEMVE
jgi:hypothetical protein